jgi:hypothetical protein
MEGARGEGGGEGGFVYAGEVGREADVDLGR